MSEGATDRATTAFVTHRNLLFTVAYEVLGSAADAEDVLQESWLRWVAVDLDQVRDERAYLVRVTTRQALNRLRTARRRRESYVGAWLPEPLLTAPDVAEDVELAEALSTAMMLVLETLSPTERAVFLLRDVFDLGYDEIAAAVDRTPSAVRQVAHRARRAVAARRPREVPTAARTRSALESFRVAVETGDLQALLDVLAPDVAMIADGGGRVQATLKPVVGADRVARLILGGLVKAGRMGIELTAEHTVINGSPALLMRTGAGLDGILTVRLDGDRLGTIYYVRNPEKLGHVGHVTPVAVR